MKEDACHIPVWVSLSKLPLQCFIPEFLEAIVNRIGRFLCLDKPIATLARPSVARMCVEIDLRRPTQIWVGLYDGFCQPIIYEKLPKYCTNCHLQGHNAPECLKKKVAVLASFVEAAISYIAASPSKCSAEAQSELDPSSYYACPFSNQQEFPPSCLGVPSLGGYCQGSGPSP